MPVDLAPDFANRCTMTLLHATCIAFEEGAVLLRGPSGSGKSDLGLRLIDRGALLVADDYVGLDVVQGRLVAHTPEKIAGLLEVRGVGLLRLDYRPRAIVKLVIDLVPLEKVERLPDQVFSVIEGIKLPNYALYAFESSAAAKVRAAFYRHKSDIDEGNGHVQA